MTNNLKRQKLVTQSEALSKQFDSKFTLSNLENAQYPKDTKAREKEITFTLGQKQEEKLDKSKDKPTNRVVTLRKLMDTQTGKSES